MKLQLVTLVSSVSLVGACVSGDIRGTIQENPDIVFDVIEENPERFLEVFNRAADTAKRKHYENRAAANAKRRQEELKNPRSPKLDPARRLSGSDTSDIVVVEYADFQCPACSAAFTGIEKLKEKYGSRVAFYYKNMPLSFHPMAGPAAQYFEAILLQDRVKAAQFHAHVFRNQGSLSSEDFLKKAAKLVGADMGRLAKDIKSVVVTQRIAEDMAEFEKFRFTGTPVVVLSGITLEGAQGLAGLEEVVELTSKK